MAGYWPFWLADKVLEFHGLRSDSPLVLILFVCGMASRGLVYRHSKQLWVGYLCVSLAQRFLLGHCNVSSDNEGPVLPRSIVRAF